MFVHIGLGKTGTTLLQKKIFPICHKLGLIDYRTDIRATVKDALREFEISGTLPEKLHIQSDAKVVLFSYESLAGWNPAVWEEMCDFNASLFGRESKIIITLRDPKSYLISCYQQSIHRMNSWLTPNKFFVNRHDYEKHKLYFGRFGDYSRMIFSLDDFNLEKLEKLYYEKFSEVYITDLSFFLNLSAFATIFKINKEKCTEVGKAIHELPRVNVSYSEKLMLLDKRRYSFLLNIRLVPLSIAVKNLLSYPNELDLKRTQLSNSGFILTRYVGKFFREFTLPFIDWQFFLKERVAKLFSGKKKKFNCIVPSYHYAVDNELFYNKIKNAVTVYKLEGRESNG